jgi:signal transduction histidine kinase
VGSKTGSCPHPAVTDASPRVGRAELSTRRLFAAGAALAALIIAALAPAHAQLRGIIDADPRELWMAAVLALILLTGMIAPWLGWKTLRLLSACGAIGWVAGLAGVLPLSAAAARDAADPTMMPWLLTASGAVVIPPLLAGGLTAAWSFLGVSTALIMTHRAVIGDVTLAGWVNDTQAIMAGVVVAFICALTIDGARRLDVAGADRAGAAAVASAERGRLAARSRAAAVVHDDVLATLTIAASTLPVPLDRLASQAQRALRSLRELAHGSLASPGPLATEIAHLVRAVDPRAEVAIVGDQRATVPDEVGEALLAAFRQALENSVRHAGASARRSIVVELRKKGVSLVVRDDGSGFDEATVPPDRLGVTTSIVQRVRDVGGSAAVMSQPGHGTRVLLEWSPPSATGRIDLSEDPKLLRFGIGVIGVVYVVTQSSAAALATASASAWWIPLVICVLIFLAAEILRRSPSQIPSRARLALVTAIPLGAVAIGALSVPFTFGDLWFATATALVIVALALRGCLRVAILGSAFLAGALTLSGLAVGASPATIALVTLRPVLFIALSVGLEAMVQRMRRRTRNLHERAIVSVEHAAWDAAARDELTVRAGRVVELAAPLLQRVAMGNALTEPERRAARALEGRLRDDLRAGSLSRDVLVAAAARARARDVDVLLLDDRDGATEDQPELEAIARWMADAIDLAQERVVGRLLPLGRAGVASVVIDGRTTDLWG